MSTASLASKGQITVPVEVRNDRKGMFDSTKKIVSTEFMNAAIALRGAASRRSTPAPMFWVGQALKAIPGTKP